MTRRLVIGIWCLLLVLLGHGRAQAELPDWFAHGELACATQMQQETHIQKVNKLLDWFLSIVDEVPEDIARQFKDAHALDDKAWQVIRAHPLWRAHEIRVGAAQIRSALGPRDSRRSRARHSIASLAFSAELFSALELYAFVNPGQRIADTTKWSEEAYELVDALHTYADCIVAELASQLPADAR
jgi:hypothetical protein